MTKFSCILEIMSDVNGEEQFVRYSLPEQVYAELVKNAFVKDKFPFWKPILKVLF